MSEQPAAGVAALDPDQVSTWLGAHPEFFADHPEVLASLRLPHGEAGTVSLVERQLSQLRDDNQQLRNRIDQLLAAASRNEHIFRHFSELYVRVLACECIEELRQLLTEYLGERLELPYVAVLPLPLHDKANDGASERIMRRLRPRPYYFGRITRGEQVQLFDCSKAASVALLHINAHEPGAILAIGSRDANRFDPEMDSLLLEQLRALLGVLLPRLSGTA